jgi:hypothetical protein
MTGNLRPCHHQLDTLTELGHDLHQPHATIGSPLATLIRSTAANGTETITGRVPGVVEADCTAQSPRPPTA